MAARPERLLRHLRRLASPPTKDTTSDADLLRRFVRAHDQDAFAVLVARHGGLVLGVCHRVLRDADAAEDAFQAVWLVLARKAATLRRAEGLAAWLHGVARQVARNALRGEGRRRRREAEGRRVPPSPGPPDPLAELTGRELLVVIDEEVEQLPEVYRLPVVLVCLEGLSQEEAAERLGWTVGSLRGRLARGRQCLQARLARRGLTLSAALGAVEMARGAGVVSASLSSTTVMAATVFAAGKGGTAGLVSAHVVALGKEVLRTMCVKQFLAAGTVAVLLLGLLGAGTALQFSGSAAGGQAASAADPTQASAAAAPQPPAKQVAPGKNAEPPDLLRAQRERILIEEQKLTQMVEGALRQARSPSPDDPEAALKLLRRTLLQVWDHPDVGERIRDALLTRLLAASQEHRSAAGGPAERPAPFAWGQPHNGLRLGLAHEGPGHKEGAARFALALENVGKNDLVVNLGMMLANGKKQYPSALRLLLTDARGGVRILERAPAFIAGRVDPFVVPLPAGCRYTLRYSPIEFFVDQDPAKADVPAPGRYRAVVEFVGKAVTREGTNGDSAGLALMSYWTGTIRSAERLLVLPARPEGKEIPGAR